MTTRFLPVGLVVWVSSGIIALALGACGITPNADLPPGQPRTLPPGMVHQDGRRLVDGAGATLSLRGVNLGGWLLWEGWIWGGTALSSAAEHDFDARLSALVGSDETNAFSDQVHATFIAEADIADAARLGFDSVRVPINYRLLEDPAHPYAYREAGWAVLDRLLGWCERYGVYAVLDLHAAPGGQNALFISDPEGASLWSSEDARARTVALWRAIAERYRARNVIAGFDLLNEPTPPSGADLVALYRRIIDAVRAADPARLVFLEGSAFATDFSMFTAPMAANAAYSFHMYTWFGDDRADALARYRAVSAAQGVPLWCGEFGENSYAMIGSTVDLYQDPAAGVSGWAFWTWKKSARGGGSPFLVGFQTTAAWNELIDWLEFPALHPRPSRDRALQGMREFIDAVRFERTGTDQQMVDALLARPAHGGG